MCRFFSREPRRVTNFEHNTHNGAKQHADKCADRLEEPRLGQAWPWNVHAGGKSLANVCECYFMLSRHRGWGSGRKDARTHKHSPEFSIAYSILRLS